MLEIPILNSNNTDRSENNNEINSENQNNSLQESLIHDRNQP